MLKGGLKWFGYGIMWMWKPVSPTFTDTGSVSRRSNMSSGMQGKTGPDATALASPSGRLHRAGMFGSFMCPMKTKKVCLS